MKEDWYLERRKFFFTYKPGKAVNKFNCSPIKKEELKVKNRGGNIRIIEAAEGELLTREILGPAGSLEYINSDPENDVLKIVVKGQV